VVVASGHYHAPIIPTIPGLQLVKEIWPSRVWHSKLYRRPEIFKNKVRTASLDYISTNPAIQNILLIGAGVSSTDIAKETGPLAKRIYQTHRSGDFDLPTTLLPDNATRINDVSSFNINQSSHQPLTDDEPLPITIRLTTEELLCDIDYIVICTGYMFSLPFLKQFHKDDLRPENADEDVLVTDGKQIHNLHKGTTGDWYRFIQSTILILVDIFYIPDPTLIFIGVPFFTATFSLFDFQAIAVAAVLSGKAELPSREDTVDEYEKRVKEKGYGKHFHSLRDREEAYVQDLLSWINKNSLSPVQGHSAEWIKLKAEQRERIKGFFNADPKYYKSNSNISTVFPICS
jgi:hypothetical protein